MICHKSQCYVTVHFDWEHYLEIRNTESHRFLKLCGSKISSQQDANKLKIN